MNSSSPTSPARVDLSVATRVGAARQAASYLFTYFTDAETVGATMA